MSGLGRVVGRRAALVVAAVALVASMGVGVADAQELPTASAEAECRDGMGYIQVTISGAGDWSYRVLIDEELVADGVPEGVSSYGPYDNGPYEVLVGWDDEQLEILDTEVTVDCEPEPTTTTSGDTADTSEAPTTTAAAAAPVATPRYTG